LPLGRRETVGTEIYKNKQVKGKKIGVSVNTVGEKTKREAKSLKCPSHIMQLQ